MIRRFIFISVLALLIASSSPAFYFTTQNVVTQGAVGNGSTDDTTAIKAAITALNPGDTLLFPCGASGVYKVTSALVITTPNVTVQGQTGCANGRVKIVGSGFSGGAVMTVGTNSLSSKNALLAATVDLATSFTANSTFAASLSPGNLVYISEGGVDGNCSPSGTSTCDSNGSATSIGCEIDGCRSEVAKVASVSGTTVTLTSSLNNPYDPVANVATVQKLNTVISGVTVQNLVCDGSGTAQMCMYFIQTDSLVVSNVSAQNVTGSAISCGISGSTACGWEPTFNSITITAAGGNGGGNGAAFAIALVGYPSVNGATIGPNLNPSAFGMTLGMSGGGQLSNMTIDKSFSTTTGRGLKASAAARATYTNLTVKNAPAGDNGMDVTYYSHHDTLNGCNFSGNNTVDVATFGNYNDFLTLNSCTMSVGTNGALVTVEQATSNNGRHDQNLTISGGTYSGTSGYELIQIGGNNTTIKNATIGPGTQGIAFLVSGLTGTCINSNTFAAGMAYAYASSGASGFANSNTLNGDSVSGALPTGTCGGSGGGGGGGAPSGVNNYYVSASSGNDSNPGTQAQPWATWAKADSARALGVAGTIVHFADGTYVASTSNTCGSLGAASFCISQGGTASQPLIFQCDNGLFDNAGHPGSPGHCLLRESSDVGNPQILGTVNSNYTTIQGFDLGGDTSHPATLAQSALLIYAKDGTGNFDQVNYNYIHDVAKNANDGNGSGNGCPSEGMVGVDMGFPATATPPPSRIPQGLRFIGNFLNNMGDITNTGCNQTHGLYIGAGPNIVVQNNITANMPGSGIKLYASNCASVVTNNLVIHTGWWGILVDSSGESRNDGCLGLGITPGKSTISNNIIVNTSFNMNCGGIALGDGSANLFADNLLIGNPTNVPVVSCSSTPVGSPSTVTGTLNNANSGATTSNTMVNFQNDGTGDYHLKTGSVAIAAGSSACASGGITPCTSGVDRSGAGMSIPLPIGPYTFGGSSPIVTLTPATSDFGSSNVGQGTAFHEFTFANGTGASVTIGTTSVTSGFAKGTDGCNGATVTAGNSCKVQVQCVPGSTGPFTGTLTVPPGSGFTSQSASLSCNGTTAVAPPAWGNKGVIVIF